MPFDMFKDLLEDIRESPISVLFDKGEELRRRLIKIAVVLVAVSCILFYFSMEIIGWIKEPLLRALPSDQAKVYFKDPLEGFMVMLQVSFIGSLIICLPLLIWETLKFVLPAIPDDQKKLLKPYFFSALLLFLGGAAFCYFVVIPPALLFLVGMGTDLAEPMLLIGDYISVLGFMLLGFGVVFQLPIVLVLLGQLGILEASTLKKSRSYAIIINLIVAAILTPTPDPVSQLAMGIPMCLLYEFSILIIARMEKSNK